MKNRLLNLIFTMFKIGLFTFGGGYSMIAVFESEFVDKKKWLSKDEYYNMITIAESTPGPIAINFATYIGYKVFGFFGALLSTLFVCIPPFVIIFLISLFFDQFISLEFVEYAFSGIQVAVAYIILKAGIKMMKDIKISPLNIILLVAVIVCMITLSFLAISFSSIFYILIGMGIGIVVYFIKRARKPKMLDDGGINK